MNFTELNLSPSIINALTEIGFETPTQIQEQAIPQILNTEKDILAFARTGTGKTAAFSLPILEKIDITKKLPQTIILCPTRELCKQITNDVAKFSKYLYGLNFVPVYGGVSIDKQIQDIKKGVHIIIGTPGRVKDLIEKGIINLTNIKFFVLDEADEMISMGFKEDLNFILSKSNDTKRTLLFSATMPQELLRIAKKYMKDTIEISSGEKNQGAAEVEHIYYLINAKDRYLALKRIIDFNPDIYAIIFCRTKSETQEISDHLIKENYYADSLHGDISQAQRELVLKRFREKSLQILVATDVAARGLDINNLTHVINFRLPDQSEQYIHRSGRTGRAGKKGICISFVHSKEQGLIRDIERKIGKRFVSEKIPSGEQVCERQLISFIEKVKNTEVRDESKIPFFEQAYQLLEDLNREDLIKHFVTIEFERFLEYYKNAKDLNKYEREFTRDTAGSGRRDSRRDGRSDSRSDSRYESRERSTGSNFRSREQNSYSRDFDSDSSGQFTKFFINIGSSRRINKKDILQIINNERSLQNAEIGRIEISRNFSFIEIDKSFENDVSKYLNNVDFNGYKIRFEIKKSGNG